MCHMSVLCIVSAYLSLGSLLAVYLCISATIRSLWFPNSFFSALSRATSEALGPLLFSASCTVFREDSICWKDTHCIRIPITFHLVYCRKFTFCFLFQIQCYLTPRFDSDTALIVLFIVGSFNFQT